MGCLVAFILFFVKKAGREKVVSIANEELNSLYDFIFTSLSENGYEIDEYEPLEGKKLTAPVSNMSSFILTGTFLFLIGLLPGFVWFMFGRDRLSITLKQQKSFILVVVEMNGKKARKIWQKINFQLTRQMLCSPLKDL